MLTREPINPLMWFFFSPDEMVHTAWENRAGKHDRVLSAHNQGPWQNGRVGGWSGGAW